MRLIIKKCKNCGATFHASCGKEEFCTEKCNLLFNVKISSNGCWVWQKSKDKDGYGYAKRKGSKTIKAHRLSYELFIGEVGAAMVCHSCDNPSCVNPNHLFLGDAKINRADCAAKGRDMKGRGALHHKAKLTDEQVISILASNDGAPDEAAKYGVHRNMIYAIRKGKNWKHIPRTL